VPALRLPILRPALALAAAVAGLALAGAAAAEEPAPVVVHLGHYTDDLHAASMALDLARMLRGRDVPVTLFLDREGVRLADRRVPQSLRWGDGPSIAEKYAAFVEAGGRVVLCPHCAKAAGVVAASLREGASLGTDESVAAVFLEAAKVIDY